MNFRTWKRVVIIQTAVLVAVVCGGIWLNNKTREDARTETLEALYNYLQPSPSLPGRISIRNEADDDAKRARWRPPGEVSVGTPMVVDVSYEDGSVSYFVNAMRMTPVEVSKFVRRAIELTGDSDEWVLRCGDKIDMQTTVEMLRHMTDSGVRLITLIAGNQVIALTDRNVTKPEINALFPSVE